MSRKNREREVYYPVGCPVTFTPHPDEAAIHGEGPWAALVTSRNEDGTFNLAVFTPSGEAHRQRRVHAKSIGELCPPSQGEESESAASAPSNSSSAT